MFRAGLVAFAMLALSRLLGLARESIQAGVLGTTGLADAAVLIWTLPDLVTGTLVFGALRYVLLPLWAGEGSARKQDLFAAVTTRVALIGLAFGLLVALGRHAVVDALAPGLSPDARSVAANGLLWVALALPPSFLAATFATRLNHERDFVGMYGANIIVNAVIILGLVLLALNWAGGLTNDQRIVVLGGTLMAAALLRILWLKLRLKSYGALIWQRSPPSGDAAPVAHLLPNAAVWLGAAAAAGLPLLVPIVARSSASLGGDGALTMFNYAWKLVELPHLLLIQVVGTVTFPAIAAQFRPGTLEAKTGPGPRTEQALGQAFVLSWALACAALAAVASFAPQLAQLIFGWGRMPAESVRIIGQWSALASWCLLPLAINSVMALVLVSLGRLRTIILAYAAGLSAIAAVGPLLSEGQVMLAMFLVLSGIAVALCWAEGQVVADAVTVPDFLVPLALAAGLIGASRALPALSPLQGLAGAVLFGGVVLSASVLASGKLRRALKS